MRDYGLFYLALFLLLATIFVFYLNWQNSHRELTFAMLDVGQGDALFVESPTGIQILIDGGPKNAVLQELPKVMPFWDRTLDAVIITNPDADHISGFTEVLKLYKVGAIFEPGTYNSSKLYKSISSEVKNQNIPDVLLRRGMNLGLGGGAYIEVLFPDRDVSEWSPNDGSAVMRLVYGDNSIMLTGDATEKTESIVLAENQKENLDSDILKVGHHGSRTSTSPEFVEAVSPKYGLISSGEGNSYGHPHKETLDTLASFGTKILRTDQSGTIVMKSDGTQETFSYMYQR
ncbi:MAG: MBL fold metallo-hydrolase [Candidatus Pacebacteria bacterium]|nr:MBL fold metallo-hydrolase [Candidatus Paceibacterota bacterium]